MVEWFALSVAVVSALIAAWAAAASARSAEATKEAVQTSKKIHEETIKLNKTIFQRQGVFALFEAWQTTNGTDLDALREDDGYAIALLINALTLTANVWNHDIVDKMILLQNYWPIFERVYVKIDNFPEWRDSMKGEIEIARDHMKKEAQSNVKTTHL